MTVLTIIYLLGIVPAYILTRNVIRRLEKEDYDLSSVLFVFCMSLLSWLTFLGFALSTDFIKKIKIPHWL
jgi:hypothetical protein